MAQLLLLGNYSPVLINAFPAVRRNLADGHFGDDLPPANVRQWRLVYTALPNSASPSITDPEDLVVKSWARYVWDFTRRRIEDGATFTIKDFRTEATATVKLMQDSIKLVGRSPYLFGGVELFVEEYA
ncbi:MAG: hypothetical protein AB7U82_33580 [Blastocatellales bacterium]